MLPAYFLINYVIEVAERSLGLCVREQFADE
jgi:hypothetical protein